MSDQSVPENILKIHHFVFDSINFQRKGFHQKAKGKKEIPAQINVNVRRIDTNRYIVTLSVEIEKREEYTASVSISGYCEIDDNAEQKDIILQQNAPAILFPYARAQLSLLTAQPETEPIVLPVVNFQSLYAQSNQKEMQDDPGNTANQDL